MKSLSRLLLKERIIWLDSRSKETALRTLVENITQTSGLAIADDIFKAILDREKLLSTGFGLGLAIPHAKLPGISEFAVSLGIHKKGLEYESLDDKPVHILVMIIGPSSHQEEYLQVLSRVTSFLKDNRDSLLNFKNSEEIYQLTLDY